ncbi:MAG: CvpA family protein [Clostridiales bacterium]|nr:CvpA family protein [Clostridiales bacterium]
MSWLFWVLLVMVVLFMIQGFQKGLVRTAVSMVFFLIVIIVCAWLNPHMGELIREKTDWQETITERCSEILFQGLEERTELPESFQTDFIEELPLPRKVKEKLLENNNAEGYRELAVESFSDYVAGYIGRGIINGIAFLASFLVTIIIIKVILYAVDILTELPVIGTVNRLAGMALGAVQGILWIGIGFLLISLLYETSVGAYLVSVIREDPILSGIYDGNYLMQIIMNLWK